MLWGSRLSTWATQLSARAGAGPVVLEDAELLAAFAVDVLVPCTPQRVAIFDAGGGVAKSDLNAGSPVGGLVVDAARKIVAVAEAATARGPGAGAKEDELERVEEGRLPAAVETAEEDDRLAGRWWSEVNRLPASVKAKVDQGEAVQYHDVSVG